MKTWKNIDSVLNENNTPKKVRKVAVFYKIYMHESPTRLELLERTYSNKRYLELQEESRRLNQRDVNEEWYYSVIVQSELCDVNEVGQ